MRSSDRPPPTELTQILTLLPLLQSGQALYRLQPPPCITPYDYSPELCHWWHTLERGPFPIRFDWPQWLTEAKTLERNPTLIAKADLLTLRKLVTYYLRTERFTRGTLAQILDNGQLLRILQRLAELNSETLERQSGLSLKMQPLPEAGF